MRDDYWLLHRGSEIGFTSGCEKFADIGRPEEVSWVFAWLRQKTIDPGEPVQRGEYVEMSGSALESPGVNERTTYGRVPNPGAGTARNAWAKVSDILPQPGSHTSDMCVHIR